jgi:hypothetical protein
VAGGATACLALLAVHLANSDWMRYNSLQGGMIALVAMITYAPFSTVNLVVE